MTIRDTFGSIEHILITPIRRGKEMASNSNLRNGVILPEMNLMPKYTFCKQFYWESKNPSCLLGSE